MKRILTLVLCWLLVFEAFAGTTFKAKTAASVAGGYVTSLNKVDGSFEDGTASWSASVGTITATASTEFQGNFKGVWAGTGTGTLDLQWTATASNTYELSAQVNVKGENDVYVCAYVGTTETGCKLIPALDKIQKVSVIADSVMGSAFHLRLKHTGSDAFGVDVDDGKIEPWTQNVANLVQQESVTYSGYSSGTNPVVFKTKDTQRSNEKNLIAISTVGSAGTASRYTILKPCNVTISTSVNGTANNQLVIQHYDSGGVLLKTPWQESPNGRTSVSGTTRANAGDYFVIYSSTSVADGQTVTFSITAQAVSDNVVQSWQPSGSLGELKFLPQNIAPQGFIPAMGSSIGKTAGTYRGDQYFDLYKVLWTQSSTTAGEPYVISSAKGASADADWIAGKTITIDVSGLFVRAYKSGTTAAVGAKQADALQDHYHNVYVPSTAGASSLWGFGMQTSRSTTLGDNTTASNYPVRNAFNANIASETRPTNIAQFAFIRYGNDAPTFLALPVSKINEFSAYVSSTGVVSDENTDWINGSCTNTPITVCTFNTSLFSSKPNCTALSADSGQGTAAGVTASITSASIQFTNSAKIPFVLKCSRGSDYTAPGAIPLNVPAAGMNYTSGAPDQVHTFSFSYGTTNATTVCSASPCSYLDQIGNYVASVTRTGTGLNTMNLNRTFAKLKCSASLVRGVTQNSAFFGSDTGFSCSNCNSLSWFSQNASSVAADSFGTILCQGQ